MPEGPGSLAAASLHRAPPAPPVTGFPVRPFPTTGSGGLVSASAPSQLLRLDMKMC